MIVDDEEISREGLAKMINWSSLGFTVVATYDDGADAIAHLTDRAVDVVLTDIRMTNASGVDLAQWVHENRPETRVVFVSAYSRFDYAQAAIRLGVVHYLVKPLVMGEVDEVFQGIRRDLDAVAPADKEAHTDKSNGEQTDPAPRVVQQAKQFIRSNAERQISLAEIADSAAVSPGYLSRLFSERTGETVSTYIRRVRVERAKSLLVASDLTVSQVCHEVGYHDVRHFYQLFKELVGMTPTQFRRRGRDGS